MHINIYCGGASRSNEPVLGGCGVVLVFVDDHKRVQFREFHYGLGLSDLLTCEFQAVRLGLASIAPPYRSVKVSLHTGSAVVAGCLTGDSHEQLAVIDEACRWYGYYKNIQVIVHGDDDGDKHLIRARELAKLGLSAQREFDSTTIRS